MTVKHKRSTQVIVGEMGIHKNDRNGGLIAFVIAFGMDLTKI